MTSAEYKEWITPQRSPEDYLSGAPRYYAISIAEYKANPFYRDNWDTGLVYPTIWATDFSEFEKYQLERFPELVKVKKKLETRSASINPLLLILILGALIYWYKKSRK